VPGSGAEAVLDNPELLHPAVSLLHHSFELVIVAGYEVMWTYHAIRKASAIILVYQRKR